MTLTVGTGTYEAHRAVKGTDSIRLYDENGVCTAQFGGITNFEPFVLTDGTWEAEAPTLDVRLAAAEEALLGLIMGV